MMFKRKGMTWLALNRLSALMGKLGEVRGENVLIQLSYSRQDLAAMSDVTTETVSCVMSGLAEERLIKSGRKWVTITDAKRLKQLVEMGAVN